MDLPALNRRNSASRYTGGRKCALAFSSPTFSIG